VFSGSLKQVANPTFWGSPKARACLILINFFALVDPKNWAFGVQNDPRQRWPWARGRKDLNLGGEWAYIPVF
jgi:hypothetical protein